VFYVICFDITSNKARYHAVKAIKGFGYRVQKSVFECPDLTEKRLLTLKDILEALIDHETDSVRYYRLCKACLPAVEWSAQGNAPHTDDFLVV